MIVKEDMKLFCGSIDKKATYSSKRSAKVQDVTELK